MNVMFQAKKVDSFRPLRDYVVVTDMDFETRITTSGIILPSDDGRSEGIRPRWCRIWSIGPEQTEYHVGQWICVDHGRWSRGIKIDHQGKEMVIRRVDTKDILLITDSEECPQDDTVSDAVSAQRKTR